MLRTDTQRKTHNNAERFKNLLPTGRYLVLSNALPENLDQMSSKDVVGYYNVTKEDSLLSFVELVLNVKPGA